MTKVRLQIVEEGPPIPLAEWDAVGGEAAESRAVRKRLVVVSGHHGEALRRAITTQLASNLGSRGQRVKTLFVGHRPSPGTLAVAAKMGAIAILDAVDESLSTCDFLVAEGNVFALVCAPSLHVFVESKASLDAALRAAKASAHVVVTDHSAGVLAALADAVLEAVLL